MPHLVFLKLGGSAITEKQRPATPRPEMIRQAAREVAHACAARPDLELLLGHGSGSFGHYAAQQSGFGERGRWQAYAETGAAAARLNRLVTDTFLEEGVPVVSFQPSASALCRDGEVQSLAVEPIRAALEHRLVPLIYGDVALDESLGMTIASTEKLFAFLAPRLHPRRIVYAADVDGIYTTDPSFSPQAELIAEITPSSFQEIEAGLGGARGADVTGGMIDKVRRNLELVDRLHGLEVFIIGMRPGLVQRALLEENFGEGTWMHAGALAGD